MLARWFTLIVCILSLAVAVIGTAVRAMATFRTENLIVDDVSTHNGNVTLGNAAADVITVTGTATVATPLTVTNNITNTGFQITTSAFVNSGQSDLGNEESDQTSFFGKPYTRGTAPTLSACGAAPAPSIVGNDKAGTVVTGGAAATCTITFNAAWATNAPICILGHRGGVDPTYSVSTTVLSLTTVAAIATYDYHCVGRL